MTTPRNNRQTASQFIKYLLVGGMNTLVTLAVIVLCKSVLGINPLVANAAGYVAGVVNSFIWNRAWVFKADGHLTSQAIKFLIGFGICYGVQFLIVWGTIRFTVIDDMLWHIGAFTLSGYGLTTIVAMGIYTICNFAYNKYVSFRGR